MRALVVVALLVVAAVLVAECKPIHKSTANSKEKLRERTRAKLAKTKASSSKGRNVVAKKQRKMQAQLASLMLDLEKHDKKMDEYKHSKSATQHTLDAEYIHKMESKMQEMSKTVESLRSQIAKLEKTAGKSKPLHTFAEDAEKEKEAPKEEKKDENKKEGHTKDAKKEAPAKKAEGKKGDDKVEEKKAHRQLEESDDLDKDSSTANLEESESQEYSGQLEESDSESGSDDGGNDAVESAIHDAAHSRGKHSKAVSKDIDDDMAEFNKDESESEATQAEKEAELEESESDSGNSEEEEDGKAEEKKSSHKKVRDMDAKPKQKKKTADNEDEDGEGNGNDANADAEPGILDSLTSYLPTMPNIFGGEEDVGAQLDDAASLEESPYTSEADDANSWF